jgi:hypothetical protein
MMGILRAKRLFGRRVDPRGEQVASGRERGPAPQQRPDESYDGPPTVPLLETDRAAMQGALLHWTPTGRFPLQALGEAYHRDAIRAFVGNAVGERALVFCTATLVPDSTDTYYAGAVAVWIAGKRVAHLMRPDALLLRQKLAADGIGLQSTTCDALITGGEISHGRQQPYIIELDLLLTGAPPTASEPTYLTPLHLSNVPVVSKDPDGDYAIRVPYITLSALEHCTVGCQLRLSTLYQGDTLAFFEPSSIGGTGRIASIKKRDVPELVANLASVVATVRQIGVRSCVIQCSIRERAEASPASTDLRKILERT